MKQRSGPRSKAFRIGVTGHRPNRLPQVHYERIRRQLSRTMATIERANPDRHYTLFTGLAEGADRLAAFVALGHQWSLHALLAFHRTRFEEDFSDDYSIGEFRALLEASSEVEEPDRTWHEGKEAEEGYAAVGAQLLRSCNILLAIWDGEPSRGKGGSVEIIQQARASGIPVVWIHASKAQSPRQLPAEKPLRSPRVTVASRSGSGLSRPSKGRRN